MLTLTVTNPKGGTGKTTTTAYLAAAFHQAGLAVAVVDADPTGTAARWADSAEWPMLTTSMPFRTLHTQVPRLGTDHDIVIIDTPPVDTQGGIIASALRISDLVIAPAGPTPADVERLAALHEALHDVAPLRAAGAPPPAVVLLTRTVAHASSTKIWRDALTGNGWHVLAATVPRREAIAQSVGDPIRDLGAYADVASELLDLLNTLRPDQEN